MTELDDQARAAAMMQYGLAHDRMIDTERMHRRREEYAAAEGAHRVSIWLLRAYAVERDDPMPVRKDGR
jgi:hypothetical protein